MNEEQPNISAGRFSRLSDAASGALDSCVRPFLRIRQRTFSAFRVCGYTGICLAAVTGTAVAAYRELPLWVLPVLTVSALATFLVLAMATKIIVGEERLIYYHHEIAILLVVGCVLWLLGQPILAFLEVTLLGVGSFLLCGRVGCFLVGCCHGCPHSFGVRYRKEHSAAGFPHALVGVRLLPVQLVESAAVTLIVAGGFVLVVRNSQPGEVLAWYTIVYGLVRFTLEFFRGDGSRVYIGSFSEAQWTTLLLMGLVAVSEFTGLLPLHVWHLAAVAGMVVFMIVWSATDGFTRHLLRPAHVRELAELLKAADAGSRDSGELHVGETGLGVQLSASTLTNTGPDLNIVAFSTPNRTIRFGTAKKIARLISRLKSSDAQLIEGRSGVYHVVFCNRGGEHAV